MRTDNQTIGSDWRTTGMRIGLISVMAASGMILAGQAAEATTTTTPSLKTHTDDGGQGHTNGAGQGHANGAGHGLPLHLQRQAGGNSGASCAAVHADFLVENDPPAETKSTCTPSSVAGDTLSTTVWLSCQLVASPLSQ
jgi:hypothetical protein